MELLHPASFASSVASSKDCLRKISLIVGKYCGEDDKKEFLSACKNLDSAKANSILDKTVKELTGDSSVSIALSVFADKFPQLNPKMSDEVTSAISEKDKVKAIDNHWKQITDIINRSGNHG